MTQILGRDRNRRRWLQHAENHSKIILGHDAQG